VQLLISVNVLCSLHHVPIFCISLGVLSMNVTASEGKETLPLHPDAVADPTISLLRFTTDSLPMFVFRYLVAI